jgi:2-dehydro-3-deoxygalactonokinase
VLGTAIAGWPRVQISLIGMAGAREGIFDTGYAECPLSLDDWRAAARGLEINGQPLRIAAGCAMGLSTGVDEVMRGEEAQVFGAMALDPSLAIGDHRLALPGTHCKWVHVTDGRIMALCTFVTGELHAWLRQSSLLGSGEPTDAAEAQEGFIAGVARSAGGEPIGASLFGVRGAQLRNGKSASWAHGHLSGLLIGAEVAALASSGDLPKVVTLIGNTELASLYAAVLAEFGTEVRAMEGDVCALAGLELLDAELPLELEVEAEG